MKAQINDGKLRNIVSDNYTSNNPLTELVKIENIDFEIPEGGIMGAVNGKYYLEGTTLKKYTQEETEASPEYIEKQIEELKRKELDKLALKEVKKLKPEYSKEIDKKIGAL